MNATADELRTGNDEPKKNWVDRSRDLEIAVKAAREVAIGFSELIANEGSEMSKEFLSEAIQVRDGANRLIDAAAKWGMS